MGKFLKCSHPEMSREVANLTEKNTHTPVYGVKEFVCLSVTNFRAVFVSSFLFQKQLIYDFEVGNNYPISPHSQGGMKSSLELIHSWGICWEIFTENLRTSFCFREEFGEILLTPSGNTFTFKFQARSKFE